jgi:uncharacterized integral membrane protein
MKTKTVIAIILLGIFTVFIMQNTMTVEIRFLIWKLTLSRVVLLLGALFTGILIGLFIGWEASARKKKSS